MTPPSSISRPLALLDPKLIATLRPDLADVVEYRKSGLSLNHIVGCPLDCAYCIRHLYGNFAMKTPKRLMSDEDAVAYLLGHPYFEPHVTPIQIFNKATDPTLPVVWPHTLRTLQLLDRATLTNHVLVITRYRVDEEMCAALNALENIRLTVLVTHSRIADRRIEPIDSAIAAQSLKTLHANADRYRVVLYWRPIVPGLNDSDEDIAAAVALSANAHATVYTGLFYRAQIADYYKEMGLPEPYDETARRRIMNRGSERRILAAFAARGTGEAPHGALFRKTSCGVAFAHGVPDYNGHFGIGPELCDICPLGQLQLCGDAWRRPDMESFTRDARALGAVGPVELTDRAVEVGGLDEHPRYSLQHRYGIQVHARETPHLPGLHGRSAVDPPHEKATH